MGIAANFAIKISLNDHLLNSTKAVSLPPSNGSQNT